MNEKNSARFVRLCVIRGQLQVNGGPLTRDEALELLSGPLTPGDDSTIVDDRLYLDMDLNKVYEVLEKDLVVHAIRLDERYVLIYPYMLSVEAKEFIKRKIMDWIQSDDRFLILDNGFQLVKVDVDQFKKDMLVTATGKPLGPNEFFIGARKD